MENINAFNTNANCFMCDIEDSLSPTWKNIINAQINLHDYCHRNLAHNNVYEISSTQHWEL